MEEDIPHYGGGACWKPIEHMAAWELKNDCKLVETSRIEVYRKTEEAEDVKKEMRSSGIRRRWSRKKNAETELIVGDDFQRKAEAKIEFEGDSGQKEPEWQLVRRRRRTKAEGRQDSDEDSLKDSDSSVSLIRYDSLCQGVGRRKKIEDGFEEDRRKKNAETPEAEQDHR